MPNFGDLTRKIDSLLIDYFNYQQCTYFKYRSEKLKSINAIIEQFLCKEGDGHESEYCMFSRFIIKFTELRTRNEDSARTSTHFQINNDFDASGRSPDYFLSEMKEISTSYGLKLGSEFKTIQKCIKKKNIPIYMKEHLLSAILKILDSVRKSLGKPLLVKMGLIFLKHGDVSNSSMLFNGLFDENNKGHHSTSKQLVLKKNRKIKYIKNNKKCSESEDSPEEEDSDINEINHKKATATKKSKIPKKGNPKSQNKQMKKWVCSEDELSDKSVVESSDTIPGEGGSTERESRKRMVTYSSEESSLASASSMDEDALKSDSGDAGDVGDASEDDDNTDGGGVNDVTDSSNFSGGDVSKNFDNSDIFNNFESGNVGAQLGSGDVDNNHSISDVGGNCENGEVVHNNNNGNGDANEEVSTTSDSQEGRELSQAEGQKDSYAPLNVSLLVKNYQNQLNGLAVGLGRKNNRGRNKDETEDAAILGDLENDSSSNTSIETLSVVTSSSAALPTSQDTRSLQIPKAFSSVSSLMKKLPSMPASKRPQPTHCQSPVKAGLSPPTKIPSSVKHSTPIKKIFFKSSKRCTKGTLSDSSSSNDSEAKYDLMRKKLPKKFIRKPQKLLWKREEELELVKLVELYGQGSWQEILNCGNFKNRSNVHLKDKWRNLCRNGKLQELQEALKASKNLR